MKIENVPTTKRPGSHGGTDDSFNIYTHTHYTRWPWSLLLLLVINFTSSLPECTNIVQV